MADEILTVPEVAQLQMVAEKTEAARKAGEQRTHRFAQARSVFAVAAHRFWGLIARWRWWFLHRPRSRNLLRVAARNVYSMARPGQLPAFKVGGQWRFKRVDIDQWIEQRKAASRDDGERE
jgi:excisionase family DNA binding protein